MIAEPDSTTTMSKLASKPLGVSPLSADEQYQLTLYKWRYSLEAYGFEPDTVRGLMFLKWLYTSQHLVS